MCGQIDVFKPPGGNTTNVWGNASHGGKVRTHDDRLNIKAAILIFVETIQRE